MLPPHEPDCPLVLATIRSWLDRRLEGDAGTWLARSLADLDEGDEDRVLYRAFSEAAMRVGKSDLDLDASELGAAAAVREGWAPVGWSLDQAARIAIVLAVHANRERFGERLDMLIRTADVAELVALYRGLPLYPASETHVGRATLGVRSNMKPVFEAVAHHDPYPAERFDEMAWNQMVLKALFVGSDLDPIVGLDDGGNERLTTMLCRYAGERWAASREVSPELWRCVGLAITDDGLACLERVLGGDDEPSRRAAILALRSSDDPRAASLLASHADFAAAVDAGGVGWPDLIPGRA